MTKALEAAAVALVKATSRHAINDAPMRQAERDEMIRMLDALTVEQVRGQPDFVQALKWSEEIIRAYAANVTEEMASASENVGRCSQCEALQDYPTPEQIRAAIERGLV